MVRAQATAKYIRTSAQKAGLVLRSDPRQGRQPRAVGAAVQPRRRWRATWPRCCARRWPTRSSRKASAATSSGCSSRRAYANNGPVAEACAAGADGPGVPRRQAHRAPHGGGDRAAAGDQGGRRRGRGRRPAGAAKRRSVARHAGRGGRSSHEEIAVGQKVHPYGFRIGFNKTWKSRWFADKDYATCCTRTWRSRRDLKKRFQHAGVAKIEIERAANKLKIDIHTSRPGHHHRPQGHRGRQAEAGDPEAHQARGLHQHPGDPEAGARRAAGRPSRWRCSSKSAWRSAARCARRSSRRCASAPAASRCACRAG